MTQRSWSRLSDAAIGRLPRREVVSLLRRLQKAIDQLVVMVERSGKPPRARRRRAHKAAPSAGG